MYILPDIQCFNTLEWYLQLLCRYDLCDQYSLTLVALDDNHNVFIKLIA